MAEHVIQCPNCQAVVLIAVEEHTGADVRQRVLVLGQIQTPAPEPAAPVETPAPDSSGEAAPGEQPQESPLTAPDESPTPVEVTNA